MYTIVFHADGRKSLDLCDSNVIKHEWHKLGLNEVLGLGEEGQFDVMNDVGPAQTSGHYMRWSFLKGTKVKKEKKPICAKLESVEKSLKTYHHLTSLSVRQRWWVLLEDKEVRRSLQTDCNPAADPSPGADKAH